MGKIPAESCGNLTKSAATLRGLLLGALLMGALSGCGAAAPLLDAPTRNALVGFERTPGEKPIWSRWARVGTLRFLEVVVGTDEVDSPLPLLVELHGLADHPHLPAGALLSLDRPFRLVAPEGPLPILDGERAWTTIRMRDDQPDELDAALEQNVEPLLELVRVVRLARPTLGAPILLGYSQGGHQAFVLGLSHPEAFGLLVPMAAWVHPARIQPPPPEITLPIRGFHALEDERVAVEPTREAYEALQAAGWDARLTLEHGSHTPPPEIDAFLVQTLEEALARITP